MTDEKIGKVIRLFLLPVLFFALGVFVGSNFFPRTNTISLPGKDITKIEYIPIKGETQTLIQYVERDKDDNAQVDLKTSAPEVVVRANDKEYKFATLDGETSAFENGQLVIRQESKSTIDITQVVNEQMEVERKALIKQYNKPNELKAGALIGVNAGYIGAEYEAKLWDIGVYGKVTGDGPDKLYKTAYTVARW